MYINSPQKSITGSVRSMKVSKNPLGIIHTVLYTHKHSLIKVKLEQNLIIKHVVVTLNDIQSPLQRDNKRKQKGHKSDGGIGVT